MKQNISMLSRADWFHGAIAGFTATLPMTLFMLATQQLLPKGQRYELPPELIIKQLAVWFHIRHRMNKRLVLGATLVSHFGYGAVMGGLYSLLGRMLTRSSVSRGALFGLIVWASSYLGLLPLIGISVTAQKEPLRRNILMIVAHIIWGGATGVATDIFVPALTNALPGPSAV